MSPLVNPMTTPSPATASPQSLSGLLPFVKPYKGRIALAGLFLLLAAGTTLAFPLALRLLIDQGLSGPDSGARLAGQFGQLFLVAAALAVFSSLRFYTVTWLGERITADVRNAVYGHVLQQSPAFFETTQTGEVLSRLSNDTTLVQTVVGSSLSMGLRNLVMGVGALLMLVYSHPMLMLQVIALLVLVVWPSMSLGRRVRKLSRASQDRVADASAMAAEVLNAIPVVQSYTAETREAQRFTDSTQQAVSTSLRRARARSALVGFIILASSAALLWGLYQGTLAVRDGTMSAGELGQTVVYVILLASAFAVLGEVYGDLLRAAGATERLMELLHTRSDIRSPAAPLQAPWPAQGSSVAMQGLDFHYPSRPQTLALSGSEWRHSTRPNRGRCGPQWRGQNHLVWFAAALSRPASWSNFVGRRQHQRHGFARPALAHWHRAARAGDFFGHRDGQHPLWPPRCHGCRGVGRCQSRVCG
jgi:ATP-binding cassette, subfamily B, bacterial